MLYIIRTTGKALVMAAVMALPLSSCIKEEALNAEADITGVSLGDGQQLMREPVINNNDVTLYANTGDSILAPVFTLTEGATISPASGTPRQFFKTEMQVTANEDGTNDTTYVYESTPQTYTVTSQDGHWTKEYSVNIVNNATPSDYHFDNVRYYMFGGQPAFQIFYETVGGNRIDWGSGNAGAMVTLAASKPSYSDYPTSQADGGVSGKCAKLTTISTGALGNMFGAPIAAGNLFLGSFVVNMQDMPASTHFGIPLHNTVPTSMTGYYKYQPGAEYRRRTGSAGNYGTEPVPGKTDDFAIYAIVYEVTDDAPYVDGNTVMTSKNIVLRAEVTDHQSGNEWVQFNVPFKQQNGKTIDEQKLIDGKYNIAIVLSSSADGASFSGAIGSTLYVDEIHLNYE
jgi:hypothetical protein